MLELSCMVAYVGPGAGLSMLGALLAVGGLVLFALLAPFIFVVRAIRTLFQRTKAPHPAVIPTHAGHKR